MGENTTHVFSAPVVGFEDEAMKIMERLLGKPKQLDVISIVGMAGIGKTTLALKIYNNDSIAHHFYIRAWISISQTYHKRDLLLGIFGSPYIQSNVDIRKMKDERLREHLYKCLKGNRYLIVMDDMWNTGAWDDLRRSFPNDNNGSKVMFTSRIRDVALHAKVDSTIYELRFLSKEESWDLLQEKIFHGSEICPPDLMEVGNEIAKKCQGLPLAIVVIGGLLAKTEKIEYWWKQVAESMGSYVASDPNQCMETLELSYIHLPNHLKPLFLYFGAFPEDYEFPVSKLMWLWIAEGLVNKNGDETLEDTSVGYLVDLIGRSLILISKRSSNGEVKSCRIHDLLRDLCVRKAKEENFMQIVNRYEQVSHNFVFLDKLLFFLKSYENKVRRLSINSFIPKNFPFEQYLNACSILIHWHDWDFRMSFSLQHFRFLKVLDLEDALYKFIPGEIQLLVHLRYLAFKWLSNDVAQSISNLRNLETLIFVSGEVQNSIKVDMSCMIKLRHLHINQSILSRPRGLESLVKLETLRMERYGVPLMVRWLDLPASLKKITLSNFGYSWRDISKLARLPKLEILKLLSNAFVGERWDTNLEESYFQFPKLKLLKFESLDIVEWNASRDYFPSLQRLVFNDCNQLKEIPLDIGDIPTLELIEVNGSSRSVAQSARQILEEQQLMGNEQLKIFIYPPDL